MKKFKNIRAYYSGWILPLVDFFIIYPTLLIMRRKTTKGIQLQYYGDKTKIEQDIRHGAFDAVLGNRNSPQGIFQLFAFHFVKTFPIRQTRLLPKRASTFVLLLTNVF